MNTYIKTDGAHGCAAVRSSRQELIRVMPEVKHRIIKASASMRRMARIGAIPTYRITANGSLGHI